MELVECPSVGSLTISSGRSFRVFENLSFYSPNSFQKYAIVQVQEDVVSNFPGCVKI